MSRCGYSYDGHGDPGWDTWRAQVASTIRGKRGQAFLRELIEALDEMPGKRLIAHDLWKGGDVCAIGSVGMRRGIDLSALAPEDYDAVASVFGITHQLVREIEWVNDECGALSPEHRWKWVRSWAVLQLIPSASDKE